MNKPFLLLLLCLLLNSVFSTANADPFDAEDQARYHQLTNELRCVVCQNQDLADSATPLAAELRQQVKLLVQQKKSNEQIKAYLSARYGEFILFKPSFSPKNYLLWLAPFVLTLLALGLWLYLAHKRRQAVRQLPLSTEESQQLDQLLKP